MPMARKQKFKNGDIKRVWFNDDVDSTKVDRKVVVWTRIHGRETHLQQALRELVEAKALTVENPKKGIGTFKRVPLSQVENSG